MQKQMKQFNMEKAVGHFTNEGKDMSPVKFETDIMSSVVDRSMCAKILSNGWGHVFYMCLIFKF